MSKLECKVRGHLNPCWNDPGGYRRVIGTLLHWSGGRGWVSRLHTDISYLNTNTADISYLNANAADISHLNSQNACIEVYVTRALVLGVTVKICVELDESADKPLYWTFTMSPYQVLNSILVKWKIIEFWEIWTWPLWKPLFLNLSFSWSGLNKLLHPAIPNGGTWKSWENMEKLENAENMKKMENINQMT